MNDGRGVLRDVAWRELFPWLLLFRTFRLSLHPAILVTALLTASVAALGWNIARGIFYQSTAPTAEKVAGTAPASPARVAAAQTLIADAQELSRFPGRGRRHNPDVLTRAREPFGVDSSPITYVFSHLSTPLLRLYNTIFDWRAFAFYLFGTLWMLAAWGFGGGLITRMAAVELGREEQASSRAALWLTCRRWFDFFTAPLYPVLGTFLIALLSMPVGWILWSSDVGAVVSALLWIFVLLGGVLTALLLLWLFIGWPLMWPAIASEETGDSFEAMSRSFAYAFQRPLHYLFYAALAALFGLICWSVVDFVCQLTLNATHWAVSWGAPHERIEQLLVYPEGTAEPTTAGRTASAIIRGIEGILLALSESFAYSYFWVAATAIYLLLRQNVDRTEFDEVWLEEDISRFPTPPTAPVTPTPDIATADKEDVVTNKAAAIENNQAE